MGGWASAHQKGSPMHSIQIRIRDTMKGFHNKAVKKGYHKRGVVPLKQSELQAAVVPAKGPDM